MNKKAKIKIGVLILVVLFLIFQIIYAVNVTNESLDLNSSINEITGNAFLIPDENSINISEENIIVENQTKEINQNLDNQLITDNNQTENININLPIEEPLNETSQINNTNLTENMVNNISLNQINTEFKINNTKIEKTIKKNKQVLSKATKTKELFSDKPIAYDFNDKETGIESVTIISNVKKNVKLTVNNVNDKPDDAVNPGLKSYKYFDIEKDNLLNTEIKEATIIFEVEKNWLNNNGKIENIVLGRLHNDVWKKYKPKYLGEKDNFYRFEVIVPGFSSFIVGLEVKDQKEISDTIGGMFANLSDNSRFGRSVANLSDLNGDGIKDLVVGSPSHEGDGSIRILFLNSTGGVSNFQLISETIGNFTGNLTGNDEFGRGIANIGDLDGDNVDDLVVSARFGNVNWGSLFVLFLQNNGIVKSYNTITSMNLPFSAFGNFTTSLTNAGSFGVSVANIGDLNNDGINDVVVGDYISLIGDQNFGTAWILFLNNKGNVTHYQEISNRSGNFTNVLNFQDQFGYSIAGVGDINNDGINDIAVGARQDPNGGNRRGAVYILFLNNDGNVKHYQKISSSEGNFSETLDDQDLFGSSVSSAGDMNHDGIPDIAVGARQDDDGGLDRGAIYILYLQRNGLVSHTRKISNTQGNFSGALSNSDYFGSSIANIGDFNNDNLTDLVVGAMETDDGGTNRGAVWMLFLDNSTDYPISPSMDVGNDSTINWNYSGEFKTIQTTNDFSQDLQTYLENTTLCPVTQDTCDIPLVFNASSGAVRVSNLSVKYNIYDSTLPIINSILVTPNPANSSSNLTIKINATDNVNLTRVNATLTNTITLSYNLTSQLYEGIILAPTEGIYQLNITATDWMNLTITNYTQINITSNKAELTLTSNNIIYNSNPLENTSLIINATVYNYGLTNANNFKVEFLVDGISKINNTISIASQKNNLTQFEWNTTYGNHTITINLDADSIVDENNETNNIINKSIFVIDNTPPIINEIIADSVAQGSNLLIKVNTTDNANVSIVTSEVNNTIINLIYNSTTKFYENSTIISLSGKYDLLINSIDITGLVTSEKTKVEIYPTQADLTFTLSDILFSQLPLTEGNDINISTIIRNKGGTNTGNFYLEFFVDRLSNENTTANVGGQLTNLSSVFWEAEYGNHTLTFRLDSRSNVIESNESNNELNISVFVEDARAPLIKSITVPSVYVNSNLPIKAEITDNVNVSNVNATIGSTTIILNYNSSSGLYENFTTSPLISGTYELNITAVDVNGLRSLRQQPIIINPIEVDLLLDGSGIVLLPRDPSEPDNLEINVTIKNEGGTDASQFTIRFTVNGTTQDKTMIIAKASSNTTTFNWTSVYSNHTINVFADYSNIISESNETNNNYTRNIFVIDIIPPSAPNATASPSNWTSQTTHAVSWDSVIDANQIDHYEYQIDYGNWINNGLLTSFVTPIQAEGIHTIFVRGVDKPGNLGYQGNTNLYIDNSNPNIPFVREWHSGNNWTIHTSPYYTWTDPGDIGSGIISYVAELDGITIQLNNNATYHPTLLSGNHTFKVYSQDALYHNSSWSNLVTIYIDTENPGNTTILSSTHPNSNQAYNISIPIFNFTSIDNHSGVYGFYYTVDQNDSTIPEIMNLWTTERTINISGIGSAISYSNISNSTGLTDGTWYIHAIAKDNVGNLGNASHYKFIVEAAIADVTTAKNAMEFAANLSLINNYTVYTDQQIYVRYLDNAQKLGKFDKVITRGNQTWAFNYLTSGESFTNFATLTNNTLVIWENQTLTASQISLQIQLLINQTKW